LDKICDAAVDNNCAVEINTKWLTRHGFLVPDSETLMYMADKGVKLVFGSDAHHCERIGYGKNAAVAAINESGHNEFSCI
jgi:histidinol-phosphatase (PHP family)